MTFKAASIAMAPDGDPQKHRATIKTSTIEATTVMVGLMNFDQAAEVCKSLVQNEGVQAISLCPGFTHAAVAKIVDAIGEGVPVNVARGDGPSMMATFQILAQEGWFPANP